MGLFAKLWRTTQTKLAVVKSQSSTQLRSRPLPAQTALAKPAGQTGAPFAIAHHRLNQQKRISQQSGKSFFSSDLSTNEYLLMRDAGCDPLGLVMGTSFYQVGFYRNFWSYRSRTGEVEALTQAQLAARELAVSRLQQEAALLGAHGVIGVRLKKSRGGWGFGMVEFTAIGTAIRISGRPMTQQPFTSDLSGQEFWQLRQAGYFPKGLVFGACSYYVHSDRTTRQLMNPTLWSNLFGQGRRNQEMVQLTQGFQDARELAILRLTQDLNHLGAQGAVGMQIEISEEVIVYQPRSLVAGLFQLFWFGIVLAVAIAIFTGNPLVIGTVAIVPYFFTHPGLLIGSWIGLSILVSSFRNTGYFRDILTHFVAVGTAIVEDKMPVVNPVSKTLIYYPLTNH